MAVVANPDLGAAIMLYLRSCSELVTLVGSAQRIFLEWPTGANALVVPTAQGKYLNCVLIETGKGGPGNIGLALKDERVDIKCYGANRKTANDIYRLMDSFLVKPDERTAMSFTLAECRVHQIFTEGPGLRLRDPSAANWDFVSAPYIFRYSVIPVG